MPIKWISQTGFVGLILFEAANYVRLLQFSLDYTWLGLLLTSIAVFAGIETINRVLISRRGKALHSLLWPLTLGAVSVDAFGDILHFYSRFPWYDQFAHALGAMVAMVLLLSVFQILFSPYSPRASAPLTLLTAFGITSVAGTLYEVEEYLEDHFNLTNRLGDGRDTANDLLMNLLGALTIVVITTVSHYGRRRIR